jgi:tRNA(Glu) U13 pseudouridine synthase TruD
MVGPKCRAGELDAAQLEREAQSALELDESAWATVARNAPGTRRDLLVRPTDVGVEVAGPEAIVVRFTLPSGSYATQLARELTRASWERPLRRESNE